MSEHWREELKATLCAWVDELPEQDSNLPVSENGVHDIQQVWSAIIALEGHTRRQAQKITAALQALGDKVDASDRTATTPPPIADSGTILVLAGFAAQLSRLSDQFRDPPKGLPFGMTRAWEARWSVLAESIAILQRQLQSLLQQFSIDQRRPEPGDPFDPEWMEAVEIKTGNNADQAVVHLIFEPGYFIDGRCVRAARISILR